MVVSLESFRRLDRLRAVCNDILDRALKTSDGGINTLKETGLTFVIDPILATTNNENCDVIQNELRNLENKIKMIL